MNAKSLLKQFRQEMVAVTMDVEKVIYKGMSIGLAFGYDWRGRVVEKMTYQPNALNQVVVV